MRATEHPGVTLKELFLQRLSLACAADLQHGCLHCLPIKDKHEDKRAPSGQVTTEPMKDKHKDNRAPRCHAQLELFLQRLSRACAAYLLLGCLHCLQMKDKHKDTTEHTHATINTYTTPHDQDTPERQQKS
ncbi:hypothetical protein DUNSADRAFT_7819 [Dunaliella salina]|uniref:Encoded protein n=1 Tax=Dunaliella salina TaxID=3046 RepID=A0ABQ7GKN1_DUNSA|nr:hypothetical protein DUNSADRAFT_7819 [Dunaliella salina]|eukprot:KAF5835144.1 hypothetical protein DUNSADRAFT_7819 [Dunaliella salina]